MSRETFVAKYDNSWQKKQRRETLKEIAIKHDYTSLLATNYPGPFGRKFIREDLAKSCPRLVITLVDRERFRKDTPEDNLDTFAIKMPHTDIFHQLRNGTVYELLDIDLFNGLPVVGRDAIEDNLDWKHLLLTVSDRNRTKNKTPYARPAGVAPLLWATEWCERNHWVIGLAKPFAYRNNPRDKRTPTYSTFLISR